MMRKCGCQTWFAVILGSCPYLESFVDHYVFTDPRFLPGWVPADRSTTIWPSIDPFAPKNQDMTPETAEAILTHVGLIAGREGDTAFTRTDGSPGRVERMCDIVRTGPPSAAETPMIVQVSRWDVIGVMDAFVTCTDGGAMPYLSWPGRSCRP
mgnify:CR=1 FL=1